MTTAEDIRLAFESIFGPTDWAQRLEWDGAPIGPEPDLYVSPNEAEHRQRGYDDWLMRGAS